MSRTVRSVWDTFWGLVVDDGQLAIGIVAALVMSWLITAIGTDDVRDAAGWLLVAILVSLLFVNLNIAGRRARRHIRDKATSSSL